MERETDRQTETKRKLIRGLIYKVKHMTRETPENIQEVETTPYILNRKI